MNGSVEVPGPQAAQQGCGVRVGPLQGARGVQLAGSPPQVVVGAVGADVDVVALPKDEQGVAVPDCALAGAGADG